LLIVQTAEKNNPNFKINNLNNFELTQENLEDQQIEVMDKLENGEITSEEAKTLNQEILEKNKSFDNKLKDNNSNITDFNGIPDWATKIGINEPEGLALDPNNSSIVEANDIMSASFSATYIGDKETVFSEARKIAQKHNLDIILDSATDFYADSTIENGKYNLSIDATSEGLNIEAADIQ